MIVLGVADGHAVVRRQAQLVERGGQTGRLVHARGQDHHGALVEDHLALEAELPDHVQHDRLVRLARGDDDAADGQRGDPPADQLRDERLGRRVGQCALLLRGRPVEHGPVLGDDPIEQLEIGEQRHQVGELAAGDEQGLAAAVSQREQGRHGGRGDLPIPGQGSVIVTREREITHGELSRSSSESQVPCQPERAGSVGEPIDRSDSPGTAYQVNSARPERPDPRRLTRSGRPRGRPPAERSGGSSAAHRSWTSGQRVRKRQPVGISRGFGGSPSRAKSRVTRRPPITGTADRSERV